MVLIKREYVHLMHGASISSLSRIEGWKENRCFHWVSTADLILVVLGSAEFMKNTEYFWSDADFMFS